MPFVSKAQRAFLRAKHPSIARRWEAAYPAKSLPKKAKKKVKKGKK